MPCWANSSRPSKAAIAARALDVLGPLEAQPPGDQSEADLAADLAERAGDRPRAVAALLGVSRAALRRGALGSARQALERASRLAGPRRDLLVDV